MDISGLPESMRERIAERSALSPIEKVRALLRGYVADAENFGEIQAEWRQAARANDFFLRQHLEALDGILAEPQPPGTLLGLVELDANWAIDHDQTDAGAAAFLRGVARMLREVLDQNDGRVE